MSELSELLVLLDRAERYSESRGDLKLFKDRYEFYRYDHSTRESVWMALDYLYGEGSANLIVNYYSGVK